MISIIESLTYTNCLLFFGWITVIGIVSLCLIEIFSYPNNSSHRFGLPMTILYSITIISVICCGAVSWARGEKRKEIMPSVVNTILKNDYYLDFKKISPSNSTLLMSLNKDPALGVDDVYYYKTKSGQYYKITFYFEISDINPDKIDFDNLTSNIGIGLLDKNIVSREIFKHDKNAYEKYFGKIEDL